MRMALLGNTNVRSSSLNDDDEDLEALRLAALESLRAKGLPPPCKLMKSPQHSNPPPPKIFQRHSANQNLIAIIPLDDPFPVVKTEQKIPSLPRSVPSPVLQCSQSNLLSQSTESIAKIETKTTISEQFVQAAEESNVKIVVGDKSDDEKPKAPTKFSRFEDSDSDDSDEVEISISKSDSEDDELVLHEDSTQLTTDHTLDSITSDEKESIEPMTMANTEATSNQSSNPIHAKHHRDPSPSKSSINESPRRSPRSPPSCKHLSPRQLSPHRLVPYRRRSLSPLRTSRSDRLQKYPTVSKKSDTSPDRLMKSRSRHEHIRYGDKYIDRPGSADTSRCYRSGHSRSQERRNDAKSTLGEKSTTIHSRRPREDQDSSRYRMKVSTDKRSDLERAQISPSTLTDSVSDSKLSDAEREKLESRKRKFETATVIDPSKTNGKIRLKSHPDSSKYDNCLQEEVIERNKEKDTKREKEEIDKRKVKKKKKKTKERKQKVKSRSNSRERVSVNSAQEELPKNREQFNDESSDLRTELQRRRVHRYEVDPIQTRIQDPLKSESRRILVVNPVSTAGSPTESSTSLHQPLNSKVISDSDPLEANSVNVSKRSGIKIKRPVVASSVEIDQGRDNAALEDRIRQIRAKNEEIRKRQLEVEADRLKYA